MQEKILDYVLKRLPAQDEKEQLEAIAKGSDVPYNTLLKLVNGQTVDPRVSTVQNLFQYFREREAA